MALFPVLRKQSSRGSTKGILLGIDGADLAEIGRSTSGAAILYTDANTSQITIGGGASLSGTILLSSTNPSVVRSQSGQNLDLQANGSSTLNLYTSSTVRIAVQSGGGVRLGTSTAAVDPGDLSAGDGTNDLFWNSSATQLQITGYSVSSSRGVLQTGTVNGLIGSTVENLSTGASGQGRTDVICGTALGALQAFSQNHSLTYKAGAVVITNSNSTNGIFIEENGDDAIYFNESAITRMRLGTNTAAGPGGLTIGDVAGAAATAATGDIVATDGTNELFWNASAASVDFLTSSTIRANGGALDLTLGARGATYALNDGANTTLNTTNQTIIGALNELDTAVTAADPNEVLLA
ncbi:MAG: hypothetical protein ACXABY_18865, partial [Candidatus Thorarchaeota archaeon]